MIQDVGLIRLADATIDDLQKNKAAILAGANVKLEKVGVATWFLPIVTHALKGGVRTVFKFAEMMSQRWGTVNIFVIYASNGSDFDLSTLQSSLCQFFPNLRFILRKHVRGRDSIDDIPFADVAFCTLWTTAYLLLKYNKTHKKFYFMQDYEPLFYAAGSVSAVIEQTYRFGFSCIANTPGVANRYKQYSDDVIFFYPGVDLDIFYPRASVGRSSKVRQVVFYGRPGNARNCFSLGALTLLALKRKMRGRVSIVSVGADWDVREFGLEGVVQNLGLLGTMESVADLYRRSDLGLVFMTTPHPSYQPLEYMACGCVVATNINEANGWLLSKENSLLVEPIPEIAAERICRLLSDEAQMNEFRARGYETVKKYNWESAFEVFVERLVAEPRT